MNKTSETKIFILGAGCSADCGYPLGVGFATELGKFLGEIPDKCPVIKQTVDSTFKLLVGLPEIQTLDQLAKYLEDEMRVRQSNKDIFPSSSAMIGIDILPTACRVMAKRLREHRRSMRLGTYLALGLLLIALNVCADEKLPALKVGNEVFSNLTVTAVTPTDIYFTYPGGMANAKLKELDPELQKHFHYNTTNAMAVEKKQIEADAQYHAAYPASHPALPPSNEDRSAPTSAGAPDSSSPRVLFIGNSYTGVNNLPQIFHDVAASAGHAPSEIKAVTPGGVTLYQHLNSPGTLKAIDEGNWDIVILQAQSLEAAMSEQLPNWRYYFLKGAAGLYDRIKAGSPHAKIILYQTWARHADYWNDPKADRSIGNNPADMQARIRKWHQNAAAQKSDFLIAPAGDAWELNYKNPNAIRLHVSDNSHPAFNGSYLAALVIYGTIYNPPDLNVAYHGDLSHAETLYLQTIATQATHKSFSP